MQLVGFTQRDRDLVRAAAVLKVVFQARVEPQDKAWTYIGWVIYK